jgi:hypothetical protein
MASVAAAVPIMGACIDRYGEGAALQMMAALGAILVVAFMGFLVISNSHGVPLAMSDRNGSWPRY